MNLENYRLAAQAQKGKYFFYLIPVTSLLLSLLIQKRKIINSKEMVGAACCLATSLHRKVCRSRCLCGASVLANAQFKWVYFLFTRGRGLRFPSYRRQSVVLRQPSTSARPNHRPSVACGGSERKLWRTFVSLWVTVSPYSLHGPYIFSGH